MKTTIEIKTIAGTVTLTQEVEGARYCFKVDGKTEHSLGLRDADTRRLCAHWTGFVENQTRHAHKVAGSKAIAGV